MQRFRFRPQAMSNTPSRITTLDTEDHQVLTGTYSDADIEAMAREDGESQFFTSKWGDGNKQARAIEALNSGTEVNLALISHRYHESLPLVEAELDELSALVAVAELAVFSAAECVAIADDSVDDLRGRCRENELSLPELHLRRSATEFTIYAFLGVGDLIFTTTAFQVFGLSDKHVGFLPFNALQLAATSTVIALLLLTRLVGQFARRARHLFERRRTTSVRSTQLRHVTDRQPLGARVAILSTVLCAASIGAILAGLSAIRASYLTEMGISAHAWEFLLIQAGIAAAGTFTSFWMSHPLDQEWHSASRNQRTCRRSFQHSEATYVDLVGRFNGLVRWQRALESQYRDWSLATIHDGRRKASMYARRLQHAQLEATDEELLPPNLQSIPLSQVEKVFGSDRNGTQASVRSYEPVNVEKFLDHLAVLKTTPLFKNQGERERMARRHFTQPIDRADTVGASNGKPRSQ